MATYTYNVSHTSPPGPRVLKFVGAGAGPGSSAVSVTIDGRPFYSGDLSWSAPGDVRYVKLGHAIGVVSVTTENAKADGDLIACSGVYTYPETNLPLLTQDPSGNAVSQSPIVAPSFKTGITAPRPLTGKESLAGTTGDFTVADLGAIGQRMTPLNSAQFTTAITGHTSHDSRTAWYFRKSVPFVWVVFRNWLPFDAGKMSIERDYIDANIGDITVSFSAEVGGTYFIDGQFENGARSIVVPPGGEVRAKLVGPFSAGSTYFIRTHVDCNASKYVPAYNTLSPNTGYLYDSASIVRATGTSGYTISASTPVYGPSAIYTDMPELGLLAWGDSIMAAVGETGSDQRYGQYVQGWLRRWANGVVGVDALGLPGATLNTLSNTWGYCESTLMALLTKRGSATIIAYGANDCLSKTFSQITTAYQTFIGNLRANGVQKIWVPLILPRTTSTDGWTTEANQTPVTGFEAGGVRDQVNAWFLSQVGPLIDVVLDVNKNVEATSKNKWKANQTSDGAHPNSTAVQNMVTGLPSIASII